MARFDSVGIFWEDIAAVRGKNRELGPMPAIPPTGWRPPSEMPNIRDAPWIGLDVETFDPDLTNHGPGWARGSGHIVGISVAAPGGKWYLPMRHEVERELNLDPEMVLRWAKWAFGNNQPKIGANIQYDIGWLRQEGVRVEGQIYDCQYAEALIESTSKLALETLGWKYIGSGKQSSILKDWAQQYYSTSDMRWRKDIYRCPVSLVGPYAEEDAEMPYRILIEQWKVLHKMGQLELFHMECDLINLLVEMRFAGIQVDIPYAEQLRDKFTLQSQELQKQAEDIVGFGINVNAAESLASAFRHLSLPFKNTAPTANNPEGKPSFTGDFLKSVNHPFAALVLGIKENEKLKGTFVESYLLNGHVNGKVHCSFHAVSGLEGGTRTGRLSSSDPNLQNIPTRTEAGKLIRKAFIMDLGHKWVRDYDYSQIEYRMLAHFATGAGADNVRALYNADPNLDYHTLIGDLIFERTGIRLSRSYVKTINFGLVYGLGIDALAVYLNTDIAKAKSLSKSFHTAIPFARTTMDHITETINRSGFVETIMGRRNHFDMWEPEDFNMRKYMRTPLPYKEALEEWGSFIVRAYTYRGTNYKLQGSAAEVMKLGMVRCWKDGVFNITSVPRLTVHDELLFSDPGNVPQDAWDEMKNIMQTSMPGMRVPIRFDSGTGVNWGEAH